ncbi:MAG: magnesium/cobalt transporter CorA [Planctomycetes bacterium]|nr:magnesium/cobalt transporter CorA [Planctomycetota bacterium]
MIQTRFFRRHLAPAGAPPGAIHVHANAIEPSFHAISYDAETLTEHAPATVAEARALLKKGRVLWLDVAGLGDLHALEEFVELFGLHHLAVADVAHVGQRPKVEDYGDNVFFVARMVTLLADGGIEWEQVSMFQSEGLVLTFQETPGDCLDPLRNRLREGMKLLRAAGSDCLACMVLDAIVDGYFPVLERYGEEFEELEPRVIEDARPQVLREVFRVKHELMTFRRAVWPLRDALSRLLREPHALISEATLPYLRDTADHAMQVVDVIENYRELCGSLVDVYLSSVSNRTNAVMRVLTVIATIFIPLTFLAGVYGMNFDTARPLNMPELGWSGGYLLFWSVCVLLSAALLFIFRRLGWLGSGRTGAPPPGE